MPSRFILNADDYGLNAQVDAAIVDLAHRGVVTATSAMVLSPRWMEAARTLCETPLDRGLHLDFTSSFAISASAGWPLATIIMQAYTGVLPVKTVREAIERQLDGFEAGLAAAPDFIDGHQHVHQLPCIRDELIEAVMARYGAERASSIRFRVCASRRWRGLKAALIHRLGAEGLSRLLKSNGWVSNTDFAGSYDFSTAADLPALWRKWLSGLVGERPLVMCHPATGIPSGADATDPIAAARVREYEWLKSPEFTTLCQEFEVRVAGPG